MDKLRIAVYLNNDFSPKTGGGFSYYQRLVNKIDNFSFDKKIEIFYISEVGVELKLRKEVIILPHSESYKKHWTVGDKLLYGLFSFGFLKYFKLYLKIKRKIKRKIDKEIINFLNQKKIDLIYYPAPDFYPLNYPFITTHWDLGHKTSFSFPELSHNNKFEKREYYHRVTLQKAFAIFVESEQSKKELINIENINSDRIFILPLFAGKVVELNVNQDEQNIILEKWNLEKENFYFYPAQFWAHKNHFALLHAFKIIVEQYPNCKLVLSGSDKGNLNYIKQQAEELNIDKKVVFTGFVADEEVYSFYKNAIALVMPTLLGPTNMPLLEAYYLGCLVLCSNLTGHKEQMKDKAIYFDPLNYEEMAMKMMQVMINRKLDKIESENLNIGKIVNQHFVKLYSIRKTFGYEY